MKEKKFSLRRTKISKAWVDKRKLKSIWISSKWDKICWIKTQPRKKSSLGKTRASTVCPQPSTTSKRCFRPSNACRISQRWNISVPIEKLPCYFNRVWGSFQQLRQIRVLSRKQKFFKWIRLTAPQALLTKSTFQQPGTSTVQNRNRSLNLIYNFRNISAVSSNRSSEPNHSPCHIPKKNRAEVTVACQN